MRKLLAIIACACLCGCSNMLVPKTNITATLAGVTFTLSSPKNYSSTNIVFSTTIRNQFGETNTAMLHIGSITAVMDPAIVQMSGDTFIQGMTIVRDTALEAAAKGAK